MYNKILVALDLSAEDNQRILTKAKTLTEKTSAELFVVHAIEYLSNYGAVYGVSAGVDIENMLTIEAEKMIKKVAADYDIDEKHQIISVGPAKFVILDEVKKRSVDLIILGSHGRHGVRILLGSTANAVLHQAPCDVLAVRCHSGK